jgi:hypothetical protein
MAVLRGFAAKIANAGHFRPPSLTPESAPKAAEKLQPTTNSWPEQELFAGLPDPPQA